MGSPQAQLSREGQPVVVLSGVGGLRKSTPQLSGSPTEAGNLQVGCGLERLSRERECLEGAASI